jgi:serine/threonine protein kinase
MQTRHPSSPSESESWLSAELEDPCVEQPPPLLQPDALIGTTLLDTYRVERVMAEGGMGRIYEAHHMRITEKRFAVKVLRPELVHSSQIRARFEREMQAVARVTHPGVLSIVDVGTTPQGWSFMVSEHLSGLDLLAYLRRFGALQNDRAVQMGCRIAEALEATHAQGVIHRDVKPSNVFLLGAFEPLGPEWDGVKLIDFGLSRFETRNDELTKTGIVMGTPAYMAPEQARGVHTDHLTDVYGVGAVLYAAATGAPPFRAETQQQTLMAAMSRDPVRPREVNASISEELEVIIQRAMSKEPADRHPSMSALRLALSNLERGARSLHLGVQSRPLPGNPRSVRLRFVALAGSLLALAILALASLASGITALSLDERMPASVAKIVLPLTLGASVGLLLLWLLSLGRSIWGNSAKLLDRLPRLRVPLFAGLVLYGLGSLFLRLAREVLPRFAESTALETLPDLAWPGWSVLLSLGALFGAIVVAVHQRYWQPMSAGRRWVLGPVAAASVALLLLSLARPEWLARGVASLMPAMVGGSGFAPGAVTPSVATPSTGLAPTALAPTTALASGLLDAGANNAAESVGSLNAHRSGSVAAGPSMSVSDAGGIPISREVAAHAERSVTLSAAPASSLTSGAVAVPALPAAPAAAPTAAASTAAAPTAAASTLQAPLLATPSLGSSPAPLPRLDRAEVLKAGAIAHSERTAELADAVRTLEQLLKLAPEKASDPIVRSILLRAASADGEPSDEAFRVMSGSMGSKGPELLYDLMLDQPALAERAKFSLSRFRVRRQFTPALAIAFDLRFSPSCGSRYSLLDRANEFGDQRSIDTLSALLGKAEKCGGPNGLPCLPLCTKEAVAFTRSIELMSKRLRTGELEAKAN